MAGVVQRDRFGERHLQAEVARAVAEIGLVEVRIAGMVEERVGPVIGPVRGPAERRAEDWRLALLGQDPAQPAPAADLLLRIAVLVQAGADRDHQQVVLVEVVGVVAETLQGFDDGDDHRVRGEYAAVDEREPVELV